MTTGNRCGVGTQCRARELEIALQRRNEQIVKLKVALRCLLDATYDDLKDTVIQVQAYDALNYEARL